MNKRGRFIVIMAVVLAGMGGALFFLSKSPAAPALPVPEREELVYITDYDETGSNPALAGVTVRNSGGEYTLKSGEKPAIEGFEDVPMDAYSLGRILNSAGRLVSRGLVTSEAEDLAVFGLEKPRAEFAVLDVGGERAAILIGSDSPDGSNVYAKREGSPEIHLVSSYEIDWFLKAPLEFADTRITPQADDSQTGLLPFEKVVLGGQARRGETFTIVNTGPVDRSEGAILAGSPYRISAPVNAAVSMDKGTPPLTSLFGLSADRAVARIAANKDLAPYGLDPSTASPWSTAELIAAAGSGIENFRLLVSKPDNGGTVFVYREGSPLVYEIAASKLPWLEVSWFDIMEKLIVLPYIDSVASVDVKTPERTVSFSLSGEGDDLSARSGAADIDMKNFRKFYQTLIGATYDEYSDASAASLPAPFLEIIYHYRDSGKNADVVSFHRASSRRVLTSFNRGKPYFTRSAYTDQVLVDLDSVLAGQQVRPYL